MPNNREILSGVFAPVTTPFKDDKPDLEALKHNLNILSRVEETWGSPTRRNPSIALFTTFPVAPDGCPLGTLSR